MSRNHVAVSAEALLQNFDNFVNSVDTTKLATVIDELGKFLEYGSSHPDRGDVFALQEIAESASRSKRPFS